MFSSLLKYLSCKPSFFQLAFEAQLTVFLNCCFIIASCFLETLFHRKTCYLIVKLKKLGKYILDTMNCFTCSKSMTVTIETNS